MPRTSNDTRPLGRASPEEMLSTRLIFKVNRSLGSLRSATLALLNGGDRDESFRRELLAGMAAEMEALTFDLDNAALFMAMQKGRLHRRPDALLLRRWMMQQLEPWPQRVEARGLVWRQQIDEQLPMIEADPHHLGLVLHNLLTNALAYTLTPGWVSVEVVDEKDEVRISVGNSGLDLSEDERRQVFEPFYTWTAYQRFPAGLGLGVTVAQRLVAAEGGRLEVAGIAGEGSRFDVHLPASQVEDEAMA